MHSSDPSHIELRKALPISIIFEEKRAGEIKGRDCADEPQKRSDITKNEASSSTVTLESVFLTGLIDVVEAREVTTVDIPAAFLYAVMDESVHMKLHGKRMI